MSEETAEKALLYIDTREKKLQPYIKSEYIEKQLDLGDIFIDSPSYKLMIERKTIADFNASLRDGRYRNQKLRLIIMRYIMMYQLRKFQKILCLRKNWELDFKNQ